MNKIYILGDIHGNINAISRLNNHCHLVYSDIVILVGDVGLNYYLNKKDKYTKEKLAKFPCKFYCLRGNHEQRASLVEGMVQVIEASGPMWKELEYPNIYYFSDVPEEYYIGGYSTLTLPGAYSVDKEYRLLNHWNWFPQEQVSKEEWAAFHPADQYDLILSHTCPFAWEPVDLFLSFIDQSKVDKSTEQQLGYLETQITYKLWVWGHYHKTRIYPKFFSSCEGQPVMLYDDVVLDLDEAMTAWLKNEFVGDAMHNINKEIT